eukprot:Gb_29925 [translate_table: standard]
MTTMLTAPYSQNTGFRGVPFSGVQQPLGSLALGRFAPNDLQVALSQLSHGGLHGHTGMTNQGGTAGSQMASSVGNAFDGSGVETNLGKTIGTGGGLTAPVLTPRVGLIPSFGNNGLLGASRPMNSVLQQDALRKQVFGANSIGQRSEEFSIQNEDFPALPRVKGNTDFKTDLHHKEQHHENTIVLMQSRHCAMGRSAGFALSHDQQQQLQQQHQQLKVSSGTVTSTAGNGCFPVGNSANLLRLHGSYPFPSSFDESGSYNSQVQAAGPSNIGGAQFIRGVWSSGPPNTRPGLSSYGQLAHHYLHHHNQSQFQVRVPVVGQSSREQYINSMQRPQVAPDRFGLLALLSINKMTNPDLAILASGVDISAFGLDLNSDRILHKTFSSPWSNRPAASEPAYTLPECYAQQSPSLQQAYFAKFQQATLFYIFYSMPNDEAQLYAANELYRRSWFYHRELHLWLTRVQSMEPLVKSNTYERGCYIYFDPSTWKMGGKENFVLHYEMLEKRPQLPLH